MTKVKGLRWWIVGLIGLATVINYIDRNALAVMWPDISRDVNLSKDEYAAIISAFMIAYAVGQGLSGRLIDRVGTRIGFTITIVAWSLSCALHGLARNIVGFSALRAALGLSEAGNWPGATKSNAEWFPIRERALAQGIFNAGASLGAVISAPLVAFLYLLVGWKVTFVVIGALGLIWVIPWWFVNRALPKHHPWLTEEERRYILEGQAVPASAAQAASGVAAAATPAAGAKAQGSQPDDERVLGWKELLGRRESWSVIASRFFLDPVWWLFVNWLPIYLADRFGFDIKQIGLFAWVPYVGAAAGSLLGGWWSGHMIHRGWTANRARKTAIVLGGVIMFPMLIAAANAATPLAAVLMIAVALFGFQVVINNIQTLPSDFFSGKSVGSLAGLGGTSAVAGVLISIWLVPRLTAVSYVPFFIFGAMLVPLGVLSVFLFAGKIQRVALALPFLLLAAGATAGANAGVNAAGLPRIHLADPSVVSANRDLAGGREPAGKTLLPAVKQLRRDAEKALSILPLSVTQKGKTPPSGDKHDYMSLGKYWWPDPQKPDGLPYVRKDGEVNPEVEQISDPKNVALLARAVSALGMACYFTGHEPYAEHAALLTRTFFLDPATRMNPNLNYAQFVPGRSDGRGFGIIDTHTFPELLDGLGYIETSPAWTAEDRRGMQKWAAEYLQWLTESKNGKEEAATRNNHGTWYDVQVVAFALFTGKTELAKEVLEGRSKGRIASQFGPDGAQAEELARTRSWDYCFFNLQGFFQLAALGERAGVDLWNYRTADGRSIRAALDWMMPYVMGVKSWEREQITDRKETGLHGLFLKAAAVWPDGKYADAAAKFAKPGVPSDRVLLTLPAGNR